MTALAKKHDVRSGTVLVAALVALAIVMSLLATMLLAAVQARRQLWVERDARQCDLLLRAGVQRARFRLAADPEYAGETWLLAADAFDDGRHGQVTIRAAKGANDDAQELGHLEIIAEYPLGEEMSVRRSFTGDVNLNNSTSEEN